MGALLLVLDGEEVVVDAGRTLTFGRSGDLVVDADNLHLHRVLGCFAAHDEGWFLQNLGRFTVLEVQEADGSARTAIGPGDQAPITYERFHVAFEAGARAYRIDGSIAPR